MQSLRFFSGRGRLAEDRRNPAADDFERSQRSCPELETVGFNGQTSGRFVPR
jgi:hypothetical protein